jgi:transposase InsO family protein
VYGYKVRPCAWNRRKCVAFDCDGRFQQEGLNTHASQKHQTRRRTGDAIANATEFKAEGMSLRNDNGSQFIAAAVRQFLKDKGIYQEFSHVATPEDNAYIEALHSNLQREVIDRFEFESIYHAQMIIDRYYKWYNEKRRHGSLNRQPLAVAWAKYNPVPFQN